MFLNVCARTQVGRKTIHHQNPNPSQRNLFLVEKLLGLFLTKKEVVSINPDKS